MDNYRFDCENQENYCSNYTYKGRVDIKVIIRDDFALEDAYYIIECKRLDGTKKLNELYIKEGMNRFISSKYSCYYECNALFGFVVNQIDVKNNINEINNLLTTNSLTEKSYPIYLSTHTLNKGNRTIDLYHLMYDFSDIIR